jgi:hypothetical protein
VYFGTTANASKYTYTITNMSNVKKTFAISSGLKTFRGCCSGNSVCKITLNPSQTGAMHMEDGGFGKTGCGESCALNLREVTSSGDVMIQKGIECASLTVHYWAPNSWIAA